MNGIDTTTCQMHTQELIQGVIDEPKLLTHFLCRLRILHRIQPAHSLVEVVAQTVNRETQAGDVSHRLGAKQCVLGGLYSRATIQLA
ncbi:hypothetical protein [Corynebacterium hadale]|uniref:hypothetical protein n=1 Tax=Corynebacterium hadale TaxID=2026255 RepID=UPI001F0A8684|nr:hypothetical protein [Corynebacterium hadale]